MPGEELRFFTLCKHVMFNTVFSNRLQLWIRYLVLDTMLSNNGTRHVVGSVPIGHEWSTMILCETGWGRIVL